MKLSIRGTFTIAEVRNEFSKLFPYLKLEFFDVAHKDHQATPKAKMLSHDKRLSACRKKHVDGEVEINPAYTVSQLETELWKKFGLSAQVFRKSGNLWIETSLTDSWTLEQQNREGFEFSGRHKNPYKEAEERDFTDRDKWE